tara:strand:+ start:2548 stop:3855 length:1308 start_codon:yes stop_codon:yes gene_type:complete
MSLPLPKVVADVGPGGGLVTAMGGINSLANDMLLRQMNQIKKQYLPTTMQAEAASKLAYANLMGPQFLAKLLGNEGAVANMGDANAKAALQKAVGAGMGQGTGNAFNQMQPQQLPMGVGQPGTNALSGWFANKLKNAFGQQSQLSQNPLAQAMPQQQSPAGMSQAQSVTPQNPMQHRPKDGVTLEGEQWYNAKGEPVYEEDVDTPDGSMKLELTKGIPPKTYAENTGEYKGTVKQKETEGKYRADALNAIGQSQLGLSNSGAVLDRMTEIIKNPTFWNMRNKIPAFQNKQLDYLKAMGTPEEKELIGDFLSTGESFIASTVQGFSGKPLVREFDLAQRQKITPHDTVESAIGKLRSARTLHDIAEQKNQIVSELLEKGYNESDAIKQANKMVDVSAIEKETNKLLQRKIEIKNSKTGEKKMVTVEEARKLGVPNV